MTLSEMIQALVDQAQELNPLLVVNVDWLDDIEEDPEVLLAMQPSWPFECQLGGPVLHDPMEVWDEEYGSEPEADDPDRQAWLDGRALEQAKPKPKTLFLHEAGGQQYLRGGVATLLGWR